MPAGLLRSVNKIMSRTFKRRSEIVFIASSGGHLEVLIGVGKSIPSSSLQWVTIEDARAESLRHEGHSVHTLPRLDKQNLNIKNPLMAPLLAWKLRPRVVVTSGAGMVVFFCVAARLLGTRLFFVETMARVTSPSHTGRLLARVVDQTFVQWPELLAAFPKATLCRPLLLEDIGNDRPKDIGTFVSLGTHDASFDRLLTMVDDAIEAGLLPEPVIVQSGSSNYEARNFTCVPWMSRDEFTQAMSQSRYVIGHGGAAFASSALRHGSTPLLLARRRSFGEHVDDHQLQLVHKLAELGLAVSLGESITARDIDAADAPLPTDNLLSTGMGLGEAVSRAIQLVITSDSK